MCVRICNCVIYMPRVLLYLLENIGVRVDTQTNICDTKEIMVFLYFMVFLCLDLRFNYNATYFNFVVGTANEKKTTFFHFFYFEGKKSFCSKYVFL